MDDSSAGSLEDAGWLATDNLELTAGLENITKEDYRNHGSGQNEAGFNAILGAKVFR